MVCTWLGELYYCSCLPVLPDPPWIQLSYVLHTFILASVDVRRATERVSETIGFEKSTGSAVSITPSCYNVLN